MKKLIMMFVVGLLIQQVAQAQGTVYLSNLDQASAGSLAVGSNSWLAEMFFTGNNSGGYTLDSIQLAMADATGNPSGFTVMIYDQSPAPSAILPGSSLETLSGSANPSTSGIYTYSDVSNLVLSPSTFYFIVLTAGTTVANGAYEWAYANTFSYNTSNGWEGGDTFLSSNGSSWTRLGSSPNYDFSEFAIDATAVPEPGFLSLFGLGSLGFLWLRRKAKAVQ